MESGEWRSGRRSERENPRSEARRRKEERCAERECSRRNEGEAKKKEILKEI